MRLGEGEGEGEGGAEGEGEGEVEVEAGAGVGMGVLYAPPLSRSSLSRLFHAWPRVRLPEKAQSSTSSATITQLGHILLRRSRRARVGGQMHARREMLGDGGRSPC